MNDWRLAWCSMLITYLAIIVITDNGRQRHVWSHACLSFCVSVCLYKITQKGPRLTRIGCGQGRYIYSRNHWLWPVTSCRGGWLHDGSESRMSARQFITFWISQFAPETESTDRPTAGMLPARGYVHDFCYIRKHRHGLDPSAGWAWISVGLMVTYVPCQNI